MKKTGISTYLKTVPTFTFYQEEEAPVHVAFYNGSIELEQNGNAINLQPEFVEGLIRAIIRHKPEGGTLTGSNN